jgi:hypothetical protein
MAKNEFLNGKILRAEYSLYGNTAQNTVNGSVYIPAGAIVTGVTFINTGAITIANAGNGISLQVINTSASSSINLISSVAMSAAGLAQTLPYVATLTAAVGTYIPVSGQLCIVQGVSNGTSVWTRTPSVFVGYLA